VVNRTGLDTASPESQQVRDGEEGRKVAGERGVGEAGGKGKAAASAGAKSKSKPPPPAAAEAAPREEKQSEIYPFHPRTAAAPPEP